MDKKTSWTQKIVNAILESNFEFGKAFIVYSADDFFRIDVFQNDLREKIKGVLKGEINVDKISDINGTDFDQSRSFKGKNPNKNTDEKMRIIVFSNHLEIGVYTGDFYEYEVLFEK
ncbi:hypothetical protein AGMMS50267_06440 [Spirochaetia bacterium]|nr:hypothetical protein AGMMS50267_06440 [Spirochaetia bacterium]